MCKGPVTRITGCLERTERRPGERAYSEEEEWGVSETER